MFFRKKKEELEDDSEEKKFRRKKKEEDDLVWDKKRILIGTGIILLLIIGAGEIKSRFFPETNILGESTTKKTSELEKPRVNSPDIDLQSQLSTSIENIKESVSSIDPEEVASSSPQIQKVLRDIQGIRNLPTDKARQACYSICSGL